MNVASWIAIAQALITLEPMARADVEAAMPELKVLFSHLQTNFDGSEASVVNAIQASIARDGEGTSAG